MSDCPATWTKPETSITASHEVPASAACIDGQSVRSATSWRTPSGRAVVVRPRLRTVTA